MKEARQDLRHHRNRRHRWLHFQGNQQDWEGFMLTMIVLTMNWEI
jgi:hypothetical protein